MWFPYSFINQSLNGVAWYLLALAFLYFLFPYIKKWIDRKSSIMALACTLLIEVLLCIVLLQFLGEESPIYIWFRYYFPILRIPDFFAGCILGKIITYDRHNERNRDSTYDKESFYKRTKFSLYEISLLFSTILICMFAKMQNVNGIILGIYNNTALLVPLAVCWIYYFLQCKGIITWSINNKVIQYIGNISAIAYLIHYVVILYLRFFVSTINPIFMESLMIKWVLVILELVITIILSELYKKKKRNSSRWENQK